MRLDKYIATKYSDLSRSRVQKMIRAGEVLVNRKPSKASYVLKDDDEVYLKKLLPEPTEISSEDFNLRVLYEDRSCLVIDKPAGMVVHPAEGGRHMTGTVANAISSLVKGEGLRPGIVHRLDKDTSGALIVAKNDKSLEALKKQFKERKVEKIYKVLVFGRLEHNEGIIDSPIGRSFRDRKKMGLVSDGKRAISKYKVRKIYDGVSMVEVEIETGRTHQIRVHMAAIGHPVVGDRAYGDGRENRSFMNEYSLKRQFLHAWKIKFKSPDTGKTVLVKSELAQDLQAVKKLIL
ncbi:MAG: RluA family pseudouridine synthase [bacterium]|nr:RluA family pseudouridine synthase [bacterium]